TAMAAVTAVISTTGTALILGCGGRTETKGLRGAKIGHEQRRSGAVVDRNRGLACSRCNKAAASRDGVRPRLSSRDAVGSTESRTVIEDAVVVEVLTQGD